MSESADPKNLVYALALNALPVVGQLGLDKVYTDRKAHV